MGSKLKPIKDVRCVVTQGTGYYSDGGMGPRKYMSYGSRYHVVKDGVNCYMIQTKKSKERLGWFPKDKFEIVELLNQDAPECKQCGGTGWDSDGKLIFSCKNCDGNGFN